MMPFLFMIISCHHKELLVKSFAFEIWGWIVSEAAKIKSPPQAPKLFNVPLKSLKKFFNCFLIGAFSYNCFMLID